MQGNEKGSDVVDIIVVVFMVCSTNAKVYQTNRGKNKYTVKAYATSRFVALGGGGGDVDDDFRFVAFVFNEEGDSVVVVDGRGVVSSSLECASLVESTFCVEALALLLLLVEVAVAIFRLRKVADEAFGLVVLFEFS